MSSRQIGIAGITYVRSRDAARVVGFTPDYVSKMAREGRIDGYFIDKRWFVDLASLNKFIVDQKRQKDLWRARLAEIR
jgi:hypothetical protein